MLPEKPTILFLSSWLPNLENRALGGFIYKQAEVISHMAKVYVLNVFGEKRSDLTIREEALSKGNLVEIRVIYAKTTFKLLGLGTLLNFIRYYFAFQRAIRIFEQFEDSPTLIHANVAFPIAPFAILCKIKYQVPLLLSEHWSGYLKADGAFKGFIRKWFTTRLINRAAAIVVVSEELKKAMMSHGLNGNYAIIGNIISTEFGVNNSNQESSIGRSKRILHISSLVNREKNIEAILRVLNTIRQVRKDYSLHIFGGDDQIANVRSWMKETGIPDGMVEFHGFVETKKLAKLIPEYDFYLHFSNFETFSCVIPEVLSCGIPVISSNTGVANEIVNDKNGILVPVKDEIALQKKIVWMLDNCDSLKLSLKNNPYESRFREKDFLNAITKVYTSIVSKK